ncbi:MAG: peptidase M61, partial [Bacteroidota bacterium]
DTLPMTELSLGALDEYEDQYYNVYQKGALIGLALDITLLDLSGGKYGVQQMMADLSSEYGKYNSFKDDELFDKITELTYPEVRAFFTRYVEGPEPLPMAEIMEKAGLIYESEGVFYDYSIGLSNTTIGIDMNEGTLFIKNEEQLDEFGKLLGLKNGDIIKAMNENPFPELGPKVQTYLQNVMAQMEEGKEFSMTVLRENESGEQKEVVLSAETIKIERIAPYTLRPVDVPTESQMVVLRSWLGLN